MRRASCAAYTIRQEVNGVFVLSAVPVGVLEPMIIQPRQGFVSVNAPSLKAGATLVASPL